MQARLGRWTFDELWAEHAPGLLRFFARRTMDPEAAMDLVAETYAAAFTGRRRFRGGGDEAAVAYLHGIARRQLAHWYRTGAVRRRAMSRLGVERPALDDEAYARVEQLAAVAPQRQAVAAALRQLSADHQEALQLRVVDELDYRDVAGRMGVSEQTARARVSRALRELEKALGQTELTA